MVSKKMLLLAGASVIPAMIGACASSQGSGARVALIHDMEPGAVFDASKDALLALGYEVAEGNRATGTIRTMPVFDSPDDQPASRPARLSSRNQTRRFAELRFERRPGGVAVHCRVVVQERTTQAHRMLAQDRSGSDTPTDTPIERGAAGTTRQNTVWQEIRRDRPAEQKIIKEVQQRVGRPVPDPSGEAPP